MAKINNALSWLPRLPINDLSSIRIPQNPIRTNTVFIDFLFKLQSFFS